MTCLKPCARKTRESESKDPRKQMYMIIYVPNGNACLVQQGRVAQVQKKVAPTTVANSNREQTSPSFFLSWSCTNVYTYHYYQHYDNKLCFFCVRDSTAKASRKRKRSWYLRASIGEQNIQKRSQISSLVVCVSLVFAQNQRERPLLMNIMKHHWKIMSFKCV